MAYMIRAICNVISQVWLRHRFKKSSTVSRFVARDVRRDVLVLDDAYIGNGYVVARVRTRNILYIARGITTEENFGTPEILHLKSIWDWDGMPWGGASLPRQVIPYIESEQLSDRLQQHFPSAQITVEIMNSEYQSWCMKVAIDGKNLEYVWGPLSGFGVIDLKNRSVENLFAYCDVYLGSMDEAVNFACDCAA
ncbi:hypothetical protein [Altericista sp. CCNU0014]|uniref:hypothetical protein n=1 Tax=Altericista sp. CCNU0014 TaxID=3082949 RepID=UPI00384E53F5